MRRAPVFLVALALWSAAARGGMVELVSRAASFGDTGGGASGSAFFSADSRYVVFTSTAPNLVASVADGNNANDVFLFDRLMGSTMLVSSSVANTGLAANGESSRPAISADGRYVTYQSTATDLVLGQIDSNGTSDVFLFDRVSGTTTLVSHASTSDLKAGNAVSENARMSGDGRYVAFQSNATDLIAGQTGGQVNSSNIFLWDRTAGVTLVSCAAGSTTVAGNSESRFPVVSRDGSTMAFFSYASDLVSGQSGAGAVFVRNRASGVTTLASHVAGTPLTAGVLSDLPTLSADGRYVAFRSTALNLVPGQISTYGYENVFLYDRVSDTTVLVSRSAGSVSTAGAGGSDYCQLTADGRYVAFMSTAPDLVAGFVDGNGPSFDIYLYDRFTDSVSLVSGHQGSPMLGANGASNLSDTSADSRWVAFSSRATNVVPGQITGVGIDNAFVFDRASGTSDLASHVPGSPLSGCNSFSFPIAVSSDGAFLILGTFATDVQTGTSDFNEVADLYLFDRSNGSNTLITRRAPTEPTLSASDSSGFPVYPGFPNAMSSDGRFIAYVSRAINLAAGQDDSNGVYDAFLGDQLSRATTLLSHRAGSATTTGNAASQEIPSVSDDGRWVAFSSYASDLAAGVTDTSGFSDIFLYDRSTGVNTLISRSAGTSVTANGDSRSPTISRDGRFVAFASLASDLVPGQTNANSATNVFLYDREAGTTVLVSHGIAPTSGGNGYSDHPLISRDGHVVVFGSGATNLASGGSGAFWFERDTGLVGFAGPAESPYLGMSEDGNWIAYASSQGNIVPGQIQSAGTLSVFLVDRLGGSTTIVSHNSNSPLATANRLSWVPSVSADGRFVAFQSDATDLVAGGTDTNGTSDAFLFDRADGKVTLISAAAVAPLVAANGISTQPVVSADGSRVAFLSNATNLVQGQETGVDVRNTFLYTRVPGTSVLASRSLNAQSMGGSADSEAPSLSANGSVVVFSSEAWDLVPGDFNGSADVFTFRLDYTAPATSFIPLPPCRLVDTRGSASYGAPSLAAGSTRTFALLLRCGIPLDAVAVSANVTVVSPAADGTLGLYPAGFSSGGSSVVSFRTGQTRASNAILGLGAGGATAVELASPGSADLVIDVNGYFK